MPQTTTATANKIAWVELSTPDAAAARDFYAKLFGWRVEVNPDPLYGGYALAKVGDADVAGIGPKMSPQTPTAWGLYIGTDDVDALSKKIQDAGGTIIAPAFDVGDQGRMAVFADPTGAILSAWQAARMRNFLSGEPNTLAWAELNSRGLERAIPFYEAVFGWTHKTSPFGEGQEYTEFQVDGESIAGALEMPPNIPAEVPSYWTVYFKADDVDASFQKAIGLGGKEMLAPQDYPGGRFAILSDPQGASFALYTGGGL
ncbi:MAG: VOC family protein [Chloroflexi bacterium]|nr:MAG: VOC family protein [Chloroflexota bacterium]